MPLFNQIGEPMPKREIEPKEAKRLANLSKLRYPDNEASIFHLSPSDFRIWYYMLDPREALLLASTNGISEKIRHQMKRRRWSLISDWFWRLNNG